LIGKTTGQTIGKYEIVQQLGEGGFSTVYLAKQPTINRAVALKVIQTPNLSEQDIDNFYREARLVASLSHPNIPKLFDFGQEGDLLYVAMEFLSGGNFDDLVSDQVASLSTVLDILDQVASALDYAHAHGVVHRDVKPGNILLDHHGNAFVTDFGVAQILSQLGTGEKLLFGTPGYMAPEQWTADANPDRRTDVYGLACTAYEALTGTPPFEATTMQEMMDHHMESVPPSVSRHRVDLSPTVDTVISKGMAKRKEDRYPSAGAFVKDLRFSLGRPDLTKTLTTNPLLRMNRPMSYTVVEKVPYAPDPTRSRQWLSNLLVMLAVLAVLGALALMARNAIDASRATPAPLNPEQSEQVDSAANPAGALNATPTGFVLVSPTPQIEIIGGTGAPTTAAGTTDLGIVATNTRSANTNATANPTTSTDTSTDSSTDTSTDPSVSGSTNATASPSAGILLVTATPSASTLPSATPAAVAVVPNGSAPRWIAFTSSRSGNNAIYLSEPAGEGVVRLTPGGANDYGPSWSPDGTQIAFTSNRDGNFEVYIINADGTGVRNVTQHPANDYDPSWSPDGTALVFTSDRDGNRELYRIDAAGTNPVNLSQSLGTDWFGDWSPDGSTILFTSDREGNSEIYAMNPDGSNIRNISANPAFDMYAVWSPDGSTLLFNTNRDGNWEVYTMNADGSNPRNVTVSPADDRYGTWSPDGRRIAFSSSRDGNREVYVLSLPNLNVTRLTNSLGDNFFPAWQP
jgi:Tol biopolymer transport system component/tRNA A-37 threonylcarbamoyl transferase component Bud32